MVGEIIAAGIGAVVGVVACGTTLFLGLRRLKLEREQLNIERDRLRVELDKQASRAESEIKKLRAETEKLVEEARELRRRRIDSERACIRDLLKLFERAVFDGPMYSEDPVEMFRAIQQTRLGLQMAGGSLVADQEAAQRFADLRSLLMSSELEVRERFPVVAQLAAQGPDVAPDFNVRKRARKALGDEYYEPVRMMMDIRHEIDDHVDVIRECLRKLDAEAQ